MKKKLWSLFPRTKEPESKQSLSSDQPSLSSSREAEALLLNTYNAGFDQGFAEGYNEGRKAGLEEAKQAAIKALNTNKE